MGQFVTENAHLRTDLEKYQRQYDHIFNKAKCQCKECEELRSKVDNNRQEETDG